MFLNLSKKPRKTNRKRCAKYKAKLKAKNKGRRARVYQLGRKLEPFLSSASSSRGAVDSRFR